MPDSDSDGFLRDPQDWFEESFPDGDGFAQWVRETGFEYSDGRSGLPIKADLDAEYAWGSLSASDRQRALIVDVGHRQAPHRGGDDTLAPEAAAPTEIVIGDGLDSVIADLSKETEAVASADSEPPSAAPRHPMDADEVAKEAAIQDSINAEGKKRRAMMRIAAGIALFASIYGCNKLVSSSDDEAVTGAPTAGASGAAPASTESADESATPIAQAAECTVGGETAPPVDLAAIEAVADDVAARARLSAEVTWSSYEYGSHIFTMAVAGDGETVSTDPQTKWYNPRFIVNHDENNLPDPTGAFTVDVGWNNDGTPDIDVLDESFSFIPGTDGSLVWLDQSTLQVTVSSPEIDAIEVETMRVELVSRVGDQDGRTLASPEGNGCWTPN